MFVNKFVTGIVKSNQSSQNVKLNKFNDCVIRITETNHNPCGVNNPVQVQGRVNKKASFIECFIELDVKLSGGSAPCDCKMLHHASRRPVAEEGSMLSL